MLKESRIERLTRALAVFGVLVTLPFISAFLPAALFVPQYPGDNQMEGREGSNEVFSMSHEVRVPLDSDDPVVTKGYKDPTKRIQEAKNTLLRQQRLRFGPLD